MKSFFRRTSQIGKQALNYQINATIHSISFNSNVNLPNTQFSVTVIRGSKIANVPPATCDRGQVAWQYVVSLPCTLYSDRASPTGFQSKQCRFEVHMHNYNTRTRTLVGVAEVDLSNYVQSSNSSMMRVPLIGSAQSRAAFRGSSVTLTLSLDVKPVTGFDPNIDSEVLQHAVAQIGMNRAAQQQQQQQMDPYRRPAQQQTEQPAHNLQMIEKSTQLFVSNRNTEEFIAPISMTVPQALYHHVPERLVITKYCRRIEPADLIFANSAAGSRGGFSSSNHSGVVEVSCSAMEHSEEATHFEELVEWMAMMEKAAELPLVPADGQTYGELKLLMVPSAMLGAAATQGEVFKCYFAGAHFLGESIKRARGAGTYGAVSGSGGGGSRRSPKVRSPREELAAKGHKAASSSFDFNDPTSNKTYNRSSSNNTNTYDDYGSGSQDNGIVQPSTNNVWASSSSSSPAAERDRDAYAPAPSPSPPPTAAPSPYAPAARDDDDDDGGGIGGGSDGGGAPRGTASLYHGLAEILQEEIGPTWLADVQSLSTDVTRQLCLHAVLDILQVHPQPLPPEQWSGTHGAGSRPAPSAAVVDECKRVATQAVRMMPTVAQRFLKTRLVSVIETAMATKFLSHVAEPPPSLQKEAVKESMESMHQRARSVASPIALAAASATGADPIADGGDAEGMSEIELLRRRLKIAEQGWAEAEAEAEILAQGVLDLNKKAAAGPGEAKKGPTGPAAAAAAAAAKARRNSFKEEDGNTDGPTLSAAAADGGDGGEGGGAMAGIPQNPFTAALAEAARKRSGSAATAPEAKTGRAAGAGAGAKAAAPAAAETGGGGSGGANDRKFKTYKMMKGAGVPEPAIRQKMANDGMSADDIATFFGVPLPSQTPAKTPPPPPVVAPPAIGPDGKPLTNLQRLHWRTVTKKAGWAQQTLDLEWQASEEMAVLRDLFTKKPAAAKGGFKPGGRAAPEAGASLVDKRRAQNVMIVLSHVRKKINSFEQLARVVQALDDRKLELEELDGLQQSLPTKQELEMVRGHARSIQSDVLSPGGTPDLGMLSTKLGIVEQFWLSLAAVPQLQVRVEAMRFRKQFQALSSELLKAITLVCRATDQILVSKKLAAVLQKVLAVGNVLNSGTTQGNAQAFHIQSLKRLTTMRGVDGRTTALDYVARSLYDNRNPQQRALVGFVDEIPDVEEAARYPPKELRGYWQELQDRMRMVEQLQTQLKADSAAAGAGGGKPPPPAAGGGMGGPPGTPAAPPPRPLHRFVSVSKGKMTALEEEMGKLKGTEESLAEYFGEENADFKMADTFEALASFVTEFKKCKAKMLAAAEAEAEKQRRLDSRSARSDWVTRNDRHDENMQPPSASAVGNASKKSSSATASSEARSLEEEYIRKQILDGARDSQQEQQHQTNRERQQQRIQKLQEEQRRRKLQQLQQQQQQQQQQQGQPRRPPNAAALHAQEQKRRMQERQQQRQRGGRYT